MKRKRAQTAPESATRRAPGAAPRKSSGKRASSADAHPPRRSSGRRRAGRRPSGRRRLMTPSRGHEGRDGRIEIGWPRKQRVRLPDFIRLLWSGCRNRSPGGSRKARPSWIRNSPALSAQDRRGWNRALILPPISAPRPSGPARRPAARSPHLLDRLRNRRLRRVGKPGKLRRTVGASVLVKSVAALVDWATAMDGKRRQYQCIAVNRHTPSFMGPSPARCRFSNSLLRSRRVSLQASKNVAH